MLHMFKQPTAEQAARKELAEAELALLEAHTGFDYAQAMVRYHETRTERLRAYVARCDQVQQAGGVRAFGSPPTDQPSPQERRF